MASQLRAVLPSMAEPINFKFLWREDHLSDYTLVICSYPAEDPLAFSNQLAQGQHPNASARQPLALSTSTAPPKLIHRQQQHLHSSSNSSRMVNNTEAAGSGHPANETWRFRHTSPNAHIELLDAGDHDQHAAHASPTAAAAAAAGAATPTGRRQQRKRGPSQQQQALTAAADPVAHNGPTTRSAKRRKSSAADAAAHQLTADPAAATAGQQRRQNSSRGAVDAPQAAAGLRIEDCNTPTAAGAAAAISSRQQSGRRAGRASTAGPCVQQDMAAAGSGALSPAAGPSGTPPPTAAAAAGAYSMTLQQQQQQQQQQQCYQQQQGQDGDVFDEAAGGGSMPAPPAAAAAGPSQPAMVVYRELPVHGAVLSAMSEYFRALIQNWQGSDRRLQMVVQEDEVAVAEALVEFMYTGDLPSVSHEDMLRLMRLSDKFQVKNCPAACARRFAETPMEELSLETICAIFDWPGFLQDAEPFKGVTTKAWSKLLELFGDLEVAWQDTNGRRQQFLELPYKAIRKLIASDELAVSSENTVLVALAEWIEAHNRRQAADGALASLFINPQHRELAELVRLQHLTPTFLGSVLKRVPIINQVATSDALQAAARYATANEATRNKLHNMPNRQPRLKVLYAPPRARSSVQRLEFTWVLDLQTVKAMIDQFRDTKVTVDRYSEPHYFNGFQWQLVLQVLEPPAKAPAAGQGSGQAAAAAAVDVFVGTTARIQIGGAQHLPDVLYFRGQLAAREVASGDFTFVNRMESGFVCGTAGWGFRNFLRITNWDDEDALRRFFWDKKIHLRCKIDQCE